MEESEFVRILAPLFYCTSPRELSADTPYKHLREWNMILAVTLTSFIEERYRVRLEAADLGRTETLADLYRCVQSKK